MESSKKTSEHLFKNVNDKIEKVEAMLAALQEEDEPDQTEIN